MVCTDNLRRTARQAGCSYPPPRPAGRRRAATCSLDSAINGGFTRDNVAGHGLTCLLPANGGTGSSADGVDRHRRRERTPRVRRTRRRHTHIQNKLTRFRTKSEIILLSSFITGGTASGGRNTHTLHGSAILPNKLHAMTFRTHCFLYLLSGILQTYKRIRT